MKDWRVIEFVTPLLKEGVSDIKLGEPLPVSGIAIHECTTRNGIKYIGEELKTAAPTLIGKPILKDHEAIVDNIVGKVTWAGYQEGVGVPYKGLIFDEKCKNLINQGLVGNVSIGAKVGNLEEIEEADGTVSIQARDIEIVELSIVPIPGDPNASIGASFDIAISEAFKLKKESEINTPLSEVECSDGECKEHPELQGQEKTSEGEKMVENRLKEQDDETPKEMEEDEEEKMKAIRAENDRLKAELENLKKISSERTESEKKTLIETYNSLSKIKNVPSLMVEKFSNENISSLIEQLKEMPDYKTESKAVVNTTVAETKKDFNLKIVESDGRTMSFYGDNSALWKSGKNGNKLD